jgi:hypothetical protein
LHHVSLDDWQRAPRVGVVVPDRDRAGWTDAALWCAWLDAWGIPASRLRVRASELSGHTTLIVPAAVARGGFADVLTAMSRRGTGLVLSGRDAAAPELDDVPGIVRFAPGADDLGPRTTERIVDTAEEALAGAAPAGLIGVWRWPDAGTAALVVDGDVDHPTGVDPECARYVAPALETAERAGFGSYGIFAAAANVEAEPASFPRRGEYYNHSFSHPYSHWNARPWGSLDEREMESEIVRSRRTFERTWGRSDQGIFRLPHFQLEASERTYRVLDRLGYRSDSSIGAHASVTGGLPFHPALQPWTERAPDAAYARTHPDPAGCHAILQVPISTDPTDLAFPNGCCSYNTLGESVRDRSAAPSDFEAVLDDVLAREVERRGLAHLFIDPPDMGYGRLSGDRADYASAVERWLARALRREHLAVLTTSELTSWWLARERAVARLRSRSVAGRLEVEVPQAQPGTTLSILRPNASWEFVPLTEALVS